MNDPAVSLNMEVCLGGFFARPLSADMVAIEKVAPRQSFLIFTGFETGDDFSWMGGEIPMDDVPRKKNNPSKEPQKSGDDPDAGGLACVGVDTCVCAIGQKRSNRCKYFLLSFEHSPPPHPRHPGQRRSF